MYLNWTNEACAAIVQEMQSYTPSISWGRQAQILSERYNENISSEQLRSAIRRYNERQAHSVWEPVWEDAAVVPTIGLLDMPDDDTPIIRDYARESIFNSLNIPETVSTNGSRFPDPVRIAEQPILTLEDANVLVIGDVHAPYHSPEMLDRAVYITQKYFPHIQHCMLIGDLFDFSAISNHLNNQPTTSTEADMRAGGKIARELRGEFQLWIGPGNHDERISKKLNSEFSMESLLCGALGNKDAGLHITDFDYFYIGDDIIAGHPTMYSSKPTGVAAKVTLMQRKNTITGHSHKVGLTVSDDGEHWSVDNGHCASAELFYYVRRRMSTFGKMGAGFTVISNGKPFIFGDCVTDWSWWR